MKIYIAGRMSQRDELREIRKKIGMLGHEVVSTWIDEGESQHLGLELKLALRDISQISLADLLILDTTSPLAQDGGGGREFEFGFAIGQFHYKRTWHIGPAKHAFHILADKQFKNWEECIECLK